MPGFSEAVQTISPPRPGAAGDLSSSALRQSQSGARRSSSAISSVAWVPQADLGQTEWLTTGRRLGAIGRCSQWWIGDWIRYGNSRWGEKYAEAARVTGYDVASLRNMAWVSSRFALSLRSDKLTWSHHVLLAPADTAAQVYWLDRALTERLSVADLRLELRAARGREGPPEVSVEAETDASAGVDVGVCPHCGHELAKTPD